MVRLIDNSEFVSESAVGEIYKERKSRGDGRLRKVKSLSELNIDDMLHRLSEGDDDSTSVVSRFHNKLLSSAQRTFKTDVRLLRWIYQKTRPRIWLIGGGSIVEGDKSYLRVDSGEIHEGSSNVMTELSRRRGTFYTDVKSYRGGILVTGGEGQNSIGTLELFNPIQNIWISLPDLPERLQYSSSAADRNDLLVSGGLNHSVGGCSDEVYRLCHNGKEWLKEENMRLPDRRFGHASIVTADGKLWVIGGNIAAVCNEDSSEERYELYNPSSCVLCFDPAVGKWEKFASMDATRIWHTAFEIDSHIYVVGGDTDSFGKAQLPTIERLNRAHGAWETVTFFPEMRKIYACTEYDGKILLVGGRGADYSTVTSLSEFDVRTNTWSKTESFLDRFNRDSFIGGGIVVQTPSASAL